MIPPPVRRSVPPPPPLPARSAAGRSRSALIGGAWLLLPGALIVAACAGSGVGGSAGAVPSGGPAGGGTTAPSPAAAPSGTLRQDDVTLTLRQGPLQVKVTPLADEVVRLTAPDTRDRLRALARAHGNDPSTALFLVSFFSPEAGVPFRERELSLVVSGLRERPAAIHPVTPGWGSQRLGSMDTQMAVYAFPARVDYDQPWSVEYDGIVNDEWGRVIPLLQRERGRLGG